MAILRSLKCFCLANFSRPASDRCLYRAIRKGRVASIVEIGIGQGLRALRMIEMAVCSGRQVRYTGIDEFESRGSDAVEGLTLKHAYQCLRQTQAAIQLVPGDPLAALTRTANSLTATDLLVISCDVDADSLLRAWWYVPRMLHRGSLVYVEESVSGGMERQCVRLAAGEVNRLAELQQTYHRKAA
jgi:predicted O-methyltransferase YrrM